MFGSSFRKLFLRTIFENKLFLLSKFIVFYVHCVFSKKKNNQMCSSYFLCSSFFKNKKIVFKNYNQMDLFFSFVDLIYSNN